MQILFNSFFKITLSETEKKILIIIFLLFLLFIFLLGLLTKSLKKSMTNKGLTIDKEINGYYKYGFVKNEKEFRAISKKKNNLLLLKQLTPSIIIIILAFLIISIYCRITSQNISYIWEIYNDMLIKFDVEWTTILGIPIWKNIPTINENSFIFHNNINGIIAYIFLILFLIGIITYIINTINYISREKRISQKMKSIFTIKLNDDLPTIN